MKRKFTNHYKTVSINQNEFGNESKSFKSSIFEKDSYSNIFLRKRNMIKSQKKQEKVNDDESQSKRYLDEPSMSMMSEIKKENLINFTPATYDGIDAKEEL